jgi:hypothetical protein
MIKRAAVAFSLLTLAGSAWGALPGSDLQRYCGALVKETAGKEELNPEELSGALFCAGYLTGFTDARFLESLGRKELYCMPEGVDNGRLAGTVVDYLTKNPERVSDTARVVVIYALKEAFPCGKKSKKTK